MAAVVGVLTKANGEKIEFIHDAGSGKTTEGRKQNLKCLTASLRKLQGNVNSSLTEVIEQEKTNKNLGSGNVESEDDADVDDDDDNDDSNEDNEVSNGNITSEKNQNGGTLEPQPKKLRM